MRNIASSSKMVATHKAPQSSENSESPLDVWPDVLLGILQGSNLLYTYIQRWKNKVGSLSYWLMNTNSDTLLFKLLRLYYTWKPENALYPFRTKLCRQSGDQFWKIPRCKTSKKKSMLPKKTSSVSPCSTLQKLLSSKSNGSIKASTLFRRILMTYGSLIDYLFFMNE